MQDALSVNLHRQWHRLLSSSYEAVQWTASIALALPAAAVRSVGEMLLL